MVEISANKSTNVRTFQAPALVTGLLLRAAGRVAPGWLARRAAMAFFSVGRIVPVHLPEGLPPPRRLTLPGGAAPVAAWAWGEGPVVLLVHGWEAEHGSMGGFIAPLLAAGLSVAALDLPGHGMTPGRSATLPEFIAAIRAAGQVLGPLHAVVGHSLGGAAAALALADGLAAGRAVLLAAPSEPGGFVALVGGLFGLDDAGLRRMGAEIERIAGRRLGDLDIAMRGPELTVPALIVQSGDDRTVPARHARRIADAWAGARLVEVQGLGHRCILADASVHRAVVDFLRP